ncbi:MAG: carboxypeptidase regulatory-like domain-containing protein [Acidobacteriaceae bacterium]|nr:carboxypeptidase regulatory-like domain-containing protein [Acidobacteriaceae bacterium]
MRVYPPLFAGILLLTALPPMLGQLQTATLTGSVTDASGGVVADATVTAEHIATHQPFTAKTTGSGDYALPSLPVGDYRITVEAKGFEKEVRPNVALNVGQTLSIDFQMAVGATTQTVEVNAQAPLVDTSDATTGQVVNSREVEALPLNQRDFLALTTLTAGVLPPRGMVQGGNLNNGGFVVHGLMRTANIVWLNGAMIVQGNGATTFLPNVDAIQEFQVKTGLYGADYGVMPGGQLIAVTKSGTNMLHGEGFEYFRNDAMDARNFFSQTKPGLKRNDFGGTFGGPIYIPKVVNGKDKAWFFVSYEKLIQHAFNPTQGVVPTDAQKNGVFSTTIIDPTNGQPFLNNSIPANRINPVAQQLLQFWPAPNTAGPVNYTSPNSSADTFTNQVLTRIDYQSSPTDRWWGQFVRDSTPNLLASPFNVFTALSPLSSWVGSIGNVKTFNGQYVNDASLNYFRRGYFPANAPGASCNFPASLNIPQLLTHGVIDKCGVPDVSIVGYSGIGDASVVGAVVIGNWWAADTFSFNKSSHFLRMGVDYRQNWYYLDENARSSFTFAARYSKNAFADFLLGDPTTTTLGGQILDANLHQNSMYGWIQDDWKVNSRLTVNLGLRYEYRFPWSDKRGLSSNFDLATQTLFPPLQANGRYQPGAPLVEYRNLEGFLPRIGMAYRLTNNTVLRTGFGINAGELIAGAPQNLGANPRPGSLNLVFNSGVTAPTISLSNPFPSALATTATPTIRGIPLSLPLTTVQEWGFSVEHQMGHNVLLDVSYDGSHTVHEYEAVQVNDAAPGPGSMASRRPYPNYQSIVFYEGDGEGWFDALEAKIEKRPGNEGLSLLGAFTWSKALATTDEIVGGTPNEVTSRSRNISVQANKGLSSSNIPLRFVFSVDYQLPFGAGKMFATTGVASKILAGWSLLTITTLQSGPWFSVFLPGDPLAAGSTSSQWPNRVCNPNLPTSQRTVQHWFDTNCFATPPQYTYGNAGRSTVEGPGIIDLDLALHRMFALAERAQVEFRAEAFNSINHPNFTLPGNQFIPGTNTSFGVVTGALDPRQIQLGLKILF